MDDSTKCASYLSSLWILWWPVLESDNPGLLLQLNGKWIIGFDSIDIRLGDSLTPNQALLAARLRGIRVNNFTPLCGYYNDIEYLVDDIDGYLGEELTIADVIDNHL